MSCGASGPLRDGRVGPYSPTTGVPTADAMWVGPVSPDTISEAPRASATISATLVCGDTNAAPEAAAATSAASACSPGPHNTTDRGPMRSRMPAASAPNLEGGQRL